MVGKQQAQDIINRYRLLEGQYKRITNTYRSDEDEDSKTEPETDTNPFSLEIDATATSDTNPTVVQMEFGAIKFRRDELLQQSINTIFKELTLKREIDSETIDTIKTNIEISAILAENEKTKYFSSWHIGSEEDVKIWFKLQAFNLRGTPEVCTTPPPSFSWQTHRSHSFTTKHNPLTYACKIGNLEIIKCLIENGADPNAYDKLSPLVIACENGNLEIIHYLLQKGADPAPQKEWYLRAINWKITPEIAAMLKESSKQKILNADWQAYDFDGAAKELAFMIKNYNCHNDYRSEDKCYQEDYSDEERSIISSKLKEKIKKGKDIQDLFLYWSGSTNRRLQYKEMVINGITIASDEYILERIMEKDAVAINFFKETLLGTKHIYYGEHKHRALILLKTILTAADNQLFIEAAQNYLSTHNLDSLNVSVLAIIIETPVLVESFRNKINSDEAKAIDFLLRVIHTADVDESLKLINDNLNPDLIINTEKFINFVRVWGSRLSTSGKEQLINLANHVLPTPAELEIFSLSCNARLDRKFYTSIEEVIKSKLTSPTANLNSESVVVPAPVVEEASLAAPAVIQEPAAVVATEPIPAAVVTPIATEPALLAASTVAPILLAEPVMAAEPPAPQPAQRPADALLGRAAPAVATTLQSVQKSFVSRWFGTGSGASRRGK